MRFSEGSQRLSGASPGGSFGVGAHGAARAGGRGLEMEVERTRDVLILRVEVAPNAVARLTLGLLSTAETDEDLIHEDLSRYNLDPSGYPGRIPAWSRRQDRSFARPSESMPTAGGRRSPPSLQRPAEGRRPGPRSQRFVFADSRAARGPGGAYRGVGRWWSGESYTLPDLLSRKEHPTELRWPR